MPPKVPILSRSVSPTVTPTGAVGKVTVHDETSGKFAADLAGSVGELAKAIGKARNDAEETLALQAQADYEGEILKAKDEQSQKRLRHALGSSEVAMKSVRESDASKNLKQVYENVSPKVRAKLLAWQTRADNRANSTFGGHENSEGYSYQRQLRKDNVAFNQRAIDTAVNVKDIAGLAQELKKSYDSLAELEGQDKKQATMKAAQGVGDSINRKIKTLVGNKEPDLALAIYQNIEKELAKTKPGPGFMKQFKTVLGTISGTELRNAVEARRIIREVDAMNIPADAKAKRVFEVSKNPEATKEAVAHFNRQSTATLKFEKEESDRIVNTAADTAYTAALEGKALRIDEVVPKSVLDSLSMSDYKKLSSALDTQQTGNTKMDAYFERQRANVSKNLDMYATLLKTEHGRKLLYGKMGGPNLKKFSAELKEAKKARKAKKAMGLTYTDSQVDRRVKRALLAKMPAGAEMTEDRLEKMASGYLLKVQDFYNKWAEDNEGSKPPRRVIDAYVDTVIIPGEIKYEQDKEARGFTNRATHVLKELGHMFGLSDDPGDIPADPVDPATQRAPRTDPRVAPAAPVTQQQQAAPAGPNAVERAAMKKQMQKYGIKVSNVMAADGEILASEANALLAAVRSGNQQAINKALRELKAKYGRR